MKMCASLLFLTVTILTVSGNNVTTEEKADSRNLELQSAWLPWRKCADENICHWERLHQCSTMTNPHYQCGKNYWKEQHKNCRSCDGAAVWFQKHDPICEGNTCQDRIQTTTFGCSDQIGQPGCERKLTRFCELHIHCDGVWSPWRIVNAYTYPVLQYFVEVKSRFCKKEGKSSSNCAGEGNPYIEFKAFISDLTTTTSSTTTPTTTSTTRPVTTTTTTILSTTTTPSTTPTTTAKSITTPVSSTTKATTSTVMITRSRTTPVTMPTTPVTMPTTKAEMTSKSFTSTATKDVQPRKADQKRTPLPGESIESTTNTTIATSNVNKLFPDWWKDKTYVFIIQCLVILILLAVILCLVCRRRRSKHIVIKRKYNEGIGNNVATMNGIIPSNAGEIEHEYTAMLPRQTTSLPILHRPLPQASSQVRPEKPPRKNRPVSERHSSFAASPILPRRSSTSNAPQSAPGSPSKASPQGQEAQYSVLNRTDNYLRPFN